MEPITHALTSLALARTSQKRLPRFGAAILVAAGVAPDLDYLSYFGGASTFLRFHRTLLHSLPGAAVLACAIAAASLAVDRRRAPKNTAGNLGFKPAVAVCAIGLAGHLLLDLLSGVGVQLFWPFHAHWYGLDLLPNLDPWVLILFVAGLLLPELFRLVSEEIGDRKKGPRGGRAAVVTLVILFCYLGARGYFHSRAVDLLLSREFHGREPLAANAFPASSSPFEWRGVVSTDNTVEETQVSLGPGAEFDPDRSLSRYKPEESPALDAGEHTRAASRFLTYAEFPIANVIHIEDGFRFEIHDFRFTTDDNNPSNIFVRVDFDAELHVREEELRYASSPSP